MQAAVVTVIALVSAIGAAAPAHAEDPPTTQGCPYETGYEQISNKGKTMAGVGPAQANYNGSYRDAKSTFKAEVSGSVSFTYSSSVSVSASVVVADVSATTGISVSTSLTATLGNTIEIWHASGTTAHAQYGVWRLKTTGYWIVDRTNCTTSSYYTTAWSPWYVGWNTWVS